MRVAALAGADSAAPVALVSLDSAVELGGTRRGAGLRLLPTARTRAPLRLALARIAARVIATRAWERLGFARLADQARLIARVATAEDETRWIAFARSVRVREHAVRAVDRGSLEGAGLETDQDGCDAACKVGVVVRCTPRVRAKFHAARALRRIERVAQVSVRRLEGDVDRALSGGRSDLQSDRQTCAQSRDAEATHSEPETA